MNDLRRSVAISLAALAVVIGIALASEARLNRNEPRGRYWRVGETTIYGFAERGEPKLPPFQLPVPPIRR
jgi:hypothetical protein